MRVLIVAHYCDFDTNPDNRFLKIANMMNENEVTIITSSFNHTFKRQKMNSNYNNFTIDQVYEEGYKKNISLQRLFSHELFSKQLKGYLKKLTKPDVIYCAVPSITCAEVVFDYARKNNIRYVLDVEDLWPEAFQMAFNNVFLNKTIYHYIRTRVDNIYKRADHVVTVSETYANRIRGVRREGISTVYLGINIERYLEKSALEIITGRLKKNNYNPIFVYIGTLGASYDIQTMINAFTRLHKQCSDARLIILGDGPMEEKFKTYAMNTDASTQIQFLGRKPYGEMIDILLKCDIAINPIVKGSAGSIINKVCDYAAAGLPVINSQDNEEYRGLISKNQCGINVECEDAEDMYKAMLLLCNDCDKRNMMSVNSYKMSSELFDRNVSYKKIIDIINNKGDVHND